MGLLIFLSICCVIVYLLGSAISICDAPDATNDSMSQPTILLATSHDGRKISLEVMPTKKPMRSSDEQNHSVFEEVLGYLMVVMLLILFALAQQPFLSR